MNKQGSIQTVGYGRGVWGMEADLSVLGVRDEPVDGGEMLPLCKLLVQPPKHLQTPAHTLKLGVTTGNMH